MRIHMRSAALGAVAAAVILGGGIAYAIPDQNGVIHSCYKTGDGKLRVIDTAKGEACLQSEIALDWGQTGPQGATGPQGPTGAQGDTGTQGPQGIPGPAASGIAIIGGAADNYGFGTQIGMFTFGENKEPGMLPLKGHISELRVRLEKPPKGMIPSFTFVLIATDGNTFKNSAGCTISGSFARDCFETDPFGSDIASSWQIYLWVKTPNGGSGGDTGHITWTAVFEPK